MPICLRIDLSFMLVCIVATTAFASNSYVDYNCLPRIGMPLTSGNGSGLFGSLSLSHELQFDGMRYQSRLTVPELDSYLIPLQKGQYLWKEPGRGPIAINIERSLYGGRKIVLAVDNSGTRQIVESATTIYTYSRCILLRQQLPSHNLLWKRADMSYQIIDENAGNEVLISVKLAANGFPSQILAASSGSLFVFKYNDDQQLTECCDAFQQSMARITYRDKLMTSFSSPLMQRTYRWGKAKFNEFYTPYKPILPYVIYDGECIYDLVYRNNEAVVKYTNTTSGASGSWRNYYRDDVH